MNRVALGLAVGAGYVLGRTKKMKLAMAVGTLAAGKRMQLSPRALAELVNEQLGKNPQLKEIGQELRQELRGTGKAASGALVERQIEGLADRLHGRTKQMREQLSGVGLRDEEEEEAEEEEEEENGGAEDQEGPARKRAAKKAPTRKAAQKPPAGKGSARKAPAKQGTGRKTAAKKSAKAPTRKTAADKGGERRDTRGSAGEGRR
ncbi:DNA primase [Streptomyces yaanensis]|uniref:DNA primase n=1 Tax=Streptomyces yaanensis TaxID=1142239 RepID=A0ABV7SBG8_9ACTN|nr:DNA primase [Streptomyces sp. CGMCC 4.7035]WNB98890.1 DNA primase [Streptomyces sp. CGMCC 4.7035]